jgi:hypothetical protein
MRAIPARPPMGRVESHARLLGMFWLVYSAFRLLGGWFLTRIFTGFRLFWTPHMPFFVPGLLHGLGGILMITGVLGLLAGWGLIERQPWARTLAIVLGVLALFHFGVGTVLGIYTLWVLLPAQSAQEYQRTARVA